ncbi:hypothetical protein V6N12_062342 [Hibiscus sabdariffa]|uniref:Uncharacterized protein n=1 Tax=Hibiscus sabdariffa TaxID=183260 RepID=A0ABR2F8J3_9ROSI
MADPCCGARCLADHCRLAAWCCADCCHEHLLLLLLKFSSYLVCKPPACDQVYLPALNNGAARWLCVWHRPCGPALSMANPRCGFGCLPCRMVAWFWADAWCCAGCRMVSSSLARKSRARALVYLPVFHDGAAR